MIHSVCHLQSDLNKRIIFPLFLNVYIPEVICVYVKQKGIFLDFCCIDLSLADAKVILVTNFTGKLTALQAQNEPIPG